MAVTVAIRSDLALRGLLFYLAAYAVTNLGAFAVVAEFPRARRIADYRGLVRRYPGLAAVLVVCLLGLVGTPPTAVPGRDGGALVPAGHWSALGAYTAGAASLGLGIFGGLVLPPTSGPMLP
jgi:NADH-quinone oxidoreductase subunit N